MITWRPAVAAALLCLLAGCGGGGDSATPAAATAGTSAPPSATATEGGGDGGGDGGGGGGGGCDAARDEVRAGLAVSGFVTGVKILGGCTTASVETSLGTTPDDVSSAQGICAIAANQAYGHGVGAVTVESADHVELAAGIKGSECIGEPH